MTLLLTLLLILLDFTVGVALTIAHANQLFLGIVLITVPPLLLSAVIAVIVTIAFLDVTFNANLSVLILLLSLPLSGSLSTSLSFSLLLSL